MTVAKQHNGKPLGRASSYSAVSHPFPYSEQMRKPHGPWNSASLGGISGWQFNCFWVQIGHPQQRRWPPCLQGRGQRDRTKLVVTPCGLALPCLRDTQLIPLASCYFAPWPKEKGTLESPLLWIPTFPLCCGETVCQRKTTHIPPAPPQTLQAQATRISLEKHYIVKRSLGRKEKRWWWSNACERCRISKVINRYE